MLSRSAHPLANRRGRLGRARGQLDASRPRNSDDQVKAVEQRPRELVAKRGQPLGRARALGAGVAARATRAQVHRRDELEPRRVERLPGRPGDADDAVLERLAQRLERRPHELGQLVQEENATVREARLAGSRSRSAADDRSGRGRVVWRAKRRLGDQRPAGVDEPRDGVDPRHLERLVGCERRQDAGEPPREHGLPCARRAREQEVVRSGGGDLERAAGALLPADVGEVGLRRCRCAPVRRGRVRRRLPLAAQVGDGLRQVAERDGVDAGELGLRRRLGGAEEAREPGPARALRGREHPADRPDAAVEGELAERRVPRERGGGNLTGRSEDGERDRQVEAGSLLP